MFRPLPFGRWLATPVTSHRGLASARSRRHARRRNTGRHLSLEPLEGRLVLSTITVTNLHDDGLGSLRKAISDANSMAGVDVIKFAGGLTGSITLSSGQLTISDRLMIKGPGADRLTISGNHMSRVFDITGGSIATITGLTVADGNAADAGGIFDESGATLNLRQVVLTHNRAIGGSAGGLGIDVGGKATVSDTVLADNQAIGVLGAEIGPNAAFATGGGIGNSGTLIVTDSTFFANKAIGGDNAPISIGSGGAISNGGDVTVRNSTFIANLAIGGAVLNGTTTVSLGLGGGVLNEGTITISGSTFVGNQAIGGNGGSGASGGDGVGGGVALAFDASASITDTTLAHNQALGGTGGSGANGGNGWGGGLSVGGVSVFGSSDSSSVRLRESTIRDNLARGGDGGTGGTGGNGSGGGAFIGTGASLDVSYGTITENHAIGGAGSGGGSDGQGVGGGVYNLGTFTFDGFTVIRKNHASTSNNDIYP